MRLILAAFFAAISIYVGTLWVAQYKAQARLGELRQEVRQLCMERGNDIPSSARLKEKLEQIASDHQVELSAIEISIEAIGAGHDTSPGAQVQAGIGQINGMQMTGTMARTRAHMRTKQWLWHVEEELESSCTLERKIERVMPANFGVDPQ